MTNDQTPQDPPAPPEQPPPGDKAPEGNAPTPAAAEAEDDTAPDWQAPDYAGPLDINQANWRHRHLKPATATVQKAAPSKPDRKPR